MKEFKFLKKAKKTQGPEVDLPIPEGCVITSVGGAIYNPYTLELVKPVTYYRASDNSLGVLVVSENNPLWNWRGLGYDTI